MNAQTQNPKKLDTAIGYAIIAGAAMVLVPVLARNITPYQDALLGLAGGGIGWILRLPVVGWIIPALAFAAVQAAEIWPLLSEESPEEQGSSKWTKMLNGRWLLAILAYAIDAGMCIRYWPILQDGVSVQMLIQGFNLRFINMANLGQTFLTLIGCSLFILLLRYVRRVA